MPLTTKPTHDKKLSAKNVAGHRNMRMAGCDGVNS